MSDIVSLEGPVELIDNALVVRIPLSAGGGKLAPHAKGIGQVIRDFLVVEIQTWLAEKIRVSEGSLVIVDNRNGKFTITRSSSNDPPDSLTTR